MKFVFLSLFLSSLTNAFACSCAGFYETDFFQNFNQNESIYMAVHQQNIDVYSPWAGSFAPAGVFEVLDAIVPDSGQTNSRIVVTGQDGLNCGESMNIFSPGDTVFLLLRDGFYQNFGADTFYLDGCEKNYLKLENGLGQGYSAQEIKQYLLALYVGIQDEQGVNRILVSPNPSGSFIFLHLSDLSTGHFDVSIVSMEGREILKRTIRKNEIDISDIPEGQYVLLMTDQRGRKYFSRVQKY